MTMAERLRAAMTEARKSRDPARTLLLSTILSDLKNRDLELQRAASEDEAADVLRRAVKKRREAAEHYEKAGRDDLRQTELGQIRVIEEFLPAAVPADEIRAAVKEAIGAGAATVGQVMGKVMPRFKGRADGQVINQIVREELASG